MLELLAASHALGTLRGGARRRFEALAREQAPVRMAALAWQSRLAGMTELQQPVQPDAAVWTRIRNVIEAEQSTLAARARPAAPVPRAGGGWLQSLRLWRGFGLASALAALVAVGVGWQLKQQLDAAPAIRYVAVLNNDQAQPAMLVTFDARKGQLVMQPLDGVAPPEGKSLELWALPQGAAPRSLGVVDSSAAVKLRVSASRVQAPAMAITLEPLGGAPKGVPTGPVLFKGPLIEKTT